jgi:hypothetical protein
VIKFDTGFGALRQAGDRSDKQIGKTQGASPREAVAAENRAAAASVAALDRFFAAGDGPGTQYDRLV